MTLPCDDLQSRLAGALLGTALGDALGIPAEQLPPEVIARRFGDPVERFRLVGSTGFVSDDTEQAALVAQSLARHPADPDACAEDFRRAMLGWFLRLPWGVGFATLRACARIAAGQRPSGVPSAGNGAAMRAAVLGVYFGEHPEERQRFGRALAEVTHTDARAVEGALFVAELAALAAVSSPDAPRADLVACAVPVASHPALAEALSLAAQLAAAETPAPEAARQLGTSGYVVHTLGFATFCFLRRGDDPLAAIQEAIRAGGDTDSIAAIVGGWAGALHGEAALPATLVEHIHNGPFGPTHLRSLAHALARRRAGQLTPVPSYSPAAALARNLALYPVVLAHGFRRLIPFG